MRKFLWVVAVGALVLAVAAPVMALDIKFGTEYRVRFYDAVNLGFNSDSVTRPSSPAPQIDTPNNNARGVQVRIRPRFDVSDDNGNIAAVLRLEIGDIEFGNSGGAHGVTWSPAGVTSSGTQYLIPSGSRVGNGAGGGIGADGVNVETKWAYVDFALPFGLPARVRAGLQPWYLPKGIIVDDDAAGVRAYGSIAPVSYELAWYRVNGGPLSGGVVNISGNAFTAMSATVSGLPIAAGTSNTVDNNYDFYGGKIDVAIAPWLNPGVYYFYGDNRMQCTVGGNSAAISTAGVVTLPPGCPGTNRVRDSHFVGLTATGKIGIASYDLDWVYGSMEGGPAGSFGGMATPVTTKGWALDGAVHFPIGPVTVNLAGTYATGDRDNGGDSEAFPFISPSWNGAGGGFEMIGSGGPFDAVEFTQDAPTNLWMIGGWLEYRPVKALYLKLAYGYAGFVKKNGNCARSITAQGNPSPSATCFGPSYGGKSDENMVGKSSLGQEISLRADYDLWTGFKVQGQLGWLIPSKGDTAAEYVLQLYYNF